ncbi:MAG: hypothetical protein A3A44_02970 [Candidatus Sungbacteria bacterium RIFCSPLOWO2_01_FULL_60_25]|uniref:Glycosyltransferase RgtA/B/C/D-like domain-containing protein n=1 Tax=Candidatus Sungbacteria bacterium RIFCSPLOWO2_01_FULL_60_25 TaxID=1802281 RepID=A0A1G2LF93_9BACT|nr:MAG: hypothetical protein A3A44_02970 [Candidatus Sungbacteria bacterium RIFCSPLOWO2_01_FULL_60_25]
MLLMGIMLVLMFASSLGDAAIMDELAHIPAAYSYVFLKDARLNPEHPPLIKDIAALPLIGQDLNFPTDIKAWQYDVNGQWDQGATFLYEAGNDPARILKLMRLPMMLLAVLFGWMIWLFSRRHFGERVAFLATFLYAFSPTFITHARFVTTDLGAAVAFFIGIVAFVRFLGEPNAKNILLAGLAFGAAELLKFSLILLIPIYGVLLVAWAMVRVEISWGERAKTFLGLVLKTALIILIGLALIWLVYLWHVWNYPVERELRDAAYLLGSFQPRAVADIVPWLIQYPLLRPLGQYFLGLLMVLQRAAGGNTQYFLGEVSNLGTWNYFPILYLLKEPLALHILTLIAAAFSITRVLRAKTKSVTAALVWVRDHFIEFASIAFIAIYWTSSITSPLNIGVRHVLPTFPFIFILVAREIVAWLRSWPASDVVSWWDWLRRVYEIYIASLPRYLLAGALVLWQASSVLAAFPYYLSYYNEAGGGLMNGYQIAVDSNYDWGQDLRRLGDYVRENNTPEIGLFYFGGGSPARELGDRFRMWWPVEGQPKDGGWYAISATFQMGAFGPAVRGFVKNPQDSFDWLKAFEPVARAGTSIFIYHLPPR